MATAVLASGHSGLVQQQGNLPLPLPPSPLPLQQQQQQQQEQQQEEYTQTHHQQHEPQQQHPPSWPASTSAPRHEPFADDTARAVHAARMRQLFSPPGMIAKDGSIDQEFFRPRAVLTLHERRWGEAERVALLAGLEEHGVGRWRDIAREHLPDWDETSLRLRTARLLGCQNLSLYHGCRLRAAQVEVERAANKALGEARGAWKGGMLVDDGSGAVVAEIAARLAAAAPPQSAHQGVPSSTQTECQN